MPISPEILPVLAIFLNVFTAPIWEKAQTLIVGTLLARCRRPVTTALRQKGSGSEIDCSGPQKTGQFLRSTTRLCNLVKEALVPGQSLYKGVSVIA